MNRLFGVTSIFALGLVLIMSCSTDQSPTGTTPLNDSGYPSAPSGTVSTSSSSFSSAGRSLAQDTDDDVRCLVYEKVGYQTEVEANRVTIKFTILGAPAGEKYLHIFWDRERWGETLERFDLGEGEPRPGTDGQVFDLLGTIEKTFPPVDEATKYEILIKLHIEGRSGDCSRGREFTLEPEAATTPGGPAASTTPCGNYGGTWVTVNPNIQVCNNQVAWGAWNPALIPSPWKVCDLTLWAAYAPSASPSSFGLPTLWIDNNSCSPGAHHEIYVSYPMNDASCYDGSSCCWSDTTILPFAVCRP